MNWVEIIGTADRTDDGLLIFNGGKLPLQDGSEGVQVGVFICDQWFSEGTVEVEVSFSGVSQRNAAEIVLYYDPQTRYTLNVGLNSNQLYGIRTFDNRGWTVVTGTGTSNAIEAGRTYHLQASLTGSTVALRVDGVETVKAVLPFVLPRSQVGLFAMEENDILFSGFGINAITPRAFVVMQFSAPYHDVYSEVIKTACAEEGVAVSRIDEVSGPGIIINDINKAIRDSKLVIADISPLNANVFYEVGFAHALNKPTILLAEKGTKLPFDVSPFRTLFYENSIGGKRVFEEGLRKHIRASLEQQ